MRVISSSLKETTPLSPAILLDHIFHTHICFPSVVDLILDISLVDQYLRGRNFTEYSNETTHDLNCTKEN